MKFYRLLKLNKLIKSHHLKFLGIFLLHITKKRYLAIHFDPVNACNLRCKMCYFTDKDYVKKLKGIFPTNEIEYFGESFFKRAIKLQIGCGTEPTLYKNLDKIIKTASKHKVPYISLTTNANLLDKKTVEKWIINGLSEITVSLHGVKKETYESMMNKGNFEKFINSLKIITELKKTYPLVLRVNYTFNEDNFKELQFFYKTFSDIDINILQIRPISKLGNTEYKNFSMKKVIPIYDTIHEILIKESKKNNVKLLAHNPKQLDNRFSMDSIINKYVYIYLSPTSLYKKDFKWNKETYDKYAKRTSISKKIIKDMFSNKKKLMKSISDKLNYDIN